MFVIEHIGCDHGMMPYWSNRGKGVRILLVMMEIEHQSTCKAIRCGIRDVLTLIYHVRQK